MDYHISTTWLVVVICLAVWEMVWKGLALWKASRNQQFVWFIVILVINTVGILPIIYLLQSRKDHHGNG